MELSLALEEEVAEAVWWQKAAGTDHCLRPIASRRQNPPELLPTQPSAPTIQGWR